MKEKDEKVGTICTTCVKKTAFQIARQTQQLAVLIRNISVLYATAKEEIGRKNREIGELRTELEVICLLSCTA